jgi:hypothetical protein
MPSSGNTYQVDVFPQLVADLRPSESLEPSDNFSGMFVTPLRLGFGASRPRLDLQYHLANFWSTLLGAGLFFCGHSVIGMILR